MPGSNHGSQAILQQQLGAETVFDELFAAEDPRLNSGPQRQTLTSTEPDALARALRRLRDTNMYTSSAVRECTLVSRTVYPLLDLAVSQYSPDLQCLPM